jgi:phage/plasmid-associated DNA primase
MLTGWVRANKRMQNDKQPLDAPKAIVDFTELHRQKENKVARFFDEEVEVSATATPLGIHVYRRFVAWCEVNGEYADSQKFLTMELERLCEDRRISFKAKHGEHGAIYVGVQLKLDTEAERYATRDSYKPSF